MHRKIIYLVVFLGCISGELYSQVNLSNYSLFGNNGLIETPSARFGKDKDVSFGVSYLPEKQRVLRAKPLASPELHYNFDVVFLPFLEITGSLIRPLNIGEQPWGIGDRGIKLRLKLVNEKKYLPALAFGIHDPAGANTNNGAVYFVGSKRIFSSHKIIVDSHLGYGFDITQKIWESSTLFMDNGDKNISRLSGVFGGVHVLYGHMSFILEYDTDKINCALSLITGKYLDVKVISQDFNSLAYGIVVKI